MLQVLYADLIAGVYPPVDGLTEVMPPPSGAAGAILAFTGHCVVAADVDPVWIERACPPWDLLAAMSPTFILTLEERLGFVAGPLDLVLCAPSEAGATEIALIEEDAAYLHARVRRALLVRSEVRVYRTLDGAGLLTIGRGLAGRWEAGMEVAAPERNRGLGRALAAASRRLAPAGEGIFMQVAPGNVASMRAILAGGFVPVGTEILFRER